MKRLLFLAAVFPLLASCLVPLGYTAAKSQGMVSESDSAQYLQLSIQYWQKGQTALTAAGTDARALDSGLGALEAEFQSKIDLLTQGAGFADEYQVSDDIGISKRSMAGVALAEALGAVNQGRSLADYTAAQQQEYQKVVQATTGARGLFMANQSVWPANTVNYRWAGADNPSAVHRQALLDAMAAWTAATGGLVKFNELDSSSWTNFQLTIGVLGCIILQDSPLGTNVTGQATVGYQCGSVFGYLKLEPDLPQGDTLRRTTLHELGHVLGLLHEHQRPDRDQWIDVASAGYTLGATDMGSVQEYIKDLRWEPVQVKVGIWSVTLYFPVWGTHKNAVLAGQFDMDSVMIYSGFLTRQAWTDQGSGVTIPAGSQVPWNTGLSYGDLQAVRALYQ